MALNFLTPILDNELRSINFFNGRLLSGNDLSQEQITNRIAHHRLGQAVGEGVAFGLEVFKPESAANTTGSTVVVKPGLAINRQGQLLKLNEPVELTLLRSTEAGGNGSTPTTFGDCQPVQSNIYVAGTGIYLLTIAPAEGNDGSAPVSGLGNASASCNIDYRLEGVQFNYIQLPIAASVLSDSNHLRNRVAYQCFGAQALTDLYRHPFGPAVERYGLLDELRPTQLTDCEVPLAIVHWQADGLTFVDLWSVRRRLIRPDAFAAPSAGTLWSIFIGDRRLGEAEAMFLQFKEQSQEMRRKIGAGLGSIVATEYFDYLPAAGLLPVTGPGSPAGFNPQTFFGERASADVALIDGERLRSLLHEALYHEPIALSRSEKIQLYLIWENVQAVEQQEVSQLALVFASQALPYCGVARFDYAKWDLSRFAPRAI